MFKNLKLKIKNLRKILSIVLILLILGSVVKFWFLKPTEIRAGSLLGMNEGYGTTVNDNSGNISGTITNALWRTEDLCKVGKCLYFDGTGDLVNFGDDADLDFVAATNFTLEGWFRTPDITSGQRTLIAKHNATAGGYKVYMNSNGYLIFGVDDDSTWSPDDSASTSTIAFDDNKWHHFAAVKTGTTSISIYVDGNLYQTDSSIASTGTLANSDTFYIGMDGDGSSNGFSGFLDEVKVYSTTARTTAEIKADYSGQTSSRGTSASFGPDQSYLSNGLVGYWKMEEAGDATRLDSSGNGNTLTESASDTVAQAAGKFGYGGDFELGDTEYMTAADSTNLSVTGSLSLSAWINPETVSAGTYNILGKWDGSNESYRLMQNADEIRIEIDSSGNYVETSSSNLAAGTWYHVVGVYDSLTATAKVYINGSLATSSITGTIPSSIGDDAGILHIGAEDATGGGDSGHYDGVIDEARIYARDLSPAEVAKLYVWAPGPVGHWKMDENTGSTVNDVGSSGTSGALENGSWSTGKFGSSANLSSTSSRINLDNFPDDTGGYSVSLWFKLHQTFDSSKTLHQYLFASWDGSSTNDINIFLDESDGTLTWKHSFPPVTVFNASYNSWTANTWYHMEATYNPASGLALYVNGVLIDTDASTTRGTVLGTNTKIGNNETDGGGVGLMGVVDDVRYYNYGRTPSQVIEDMNAGHPAPGSPVGSSVAYWKFDEGYSTTAYDNSINANNLTLSAAGWTNSGKFGKAYDGATNRRMTRDDDADFDFANGTDDFTLSVWFNRGGTISNQEYLLDKHTTNDGYTLYMDSDGDIVCGIGDGAASFPEETIGGSLSKNYDDTNWHHAVCVKSGTSSLRLYVDGIEIASDTSLAVDADMSNAGKLIIGDTNETDGTDEWLGDIDEIKIFRSALNADAIKVLYNQNAGQSLGALSTNWNGSVDVPSNADVDAYCPPGQGSTCTPPVGHWKFDENTGTTANDISTNNNNGTVGNSGWIGGKFGSALNAKADNLRDAVTVTDPGSGILDFSNSQDYTHSMWLKLTATEGGGWIQVFSKGWNGGPNNAGYGLDIISVTGQVGCSYTDGNGSGVEDATGTVSVFDGNWHYVTCVMDRNGSEVGTTGLHLFVDGILSATDASLTEGSSVNASSLIIGEFSTSDEMTNGGFDNTIIYDYARTPAQIAWDMNRGAPVGWWKMDENTGTTANDSMGNSTAGTLTNTPTWVAGKFNYATSFAGSNQHILIADDPDFDFADDESMSLTAWFKHNTASAQEIIMSKYAAAGYKIIMEADGDITCGLDYDSTWTPTDSATSTLATYDDNTWHHVACVKDGATSLSLYIDGVLITTDASLTATNTLTNSDPLYLGIDADGTSNDYIGQLDDTRIYRYPLTLQQIRTIINEGAAAKY